MAEFPSGLYIKASDQDTDVLTFGKSPEKVAQDVAAGISRFGGMMRQPNYCNAYYKSAKVILSSAIENQELDDFGLPIFYLVRHSLELKLKGLINMAYDNYDMHIELNASAYPADTALSNTKRRDLESSHNLETLYNNLKIICNTLGISIPDSKFEGVLGILKTHETNPTWSRYARSRSGSHVDEEVALPIVDLVEKMDSLYLAISYEQPEQQDSLELELYSLFSSLHNSFKSQ